MDKGPLDTSNMKDNLLHGVTYDVQGVKFLFFPIFLSILLFFLFFSNFLLFFLFLAILPTISKYLLEIWTF